MATASILHVGDDLCHRVPIMKSAGLIVDQSECGADAVHAALVQNQSFSAITFHNDAFPLPDIVVSTARTLSSAPLILFKNPSVCCDDGAFDLVIPSLTPPADWLKSLRAAIEDAHNLRRISMQLRQESMNVRFQTERLRAESAGVRRNASGGEARSGHKTSKR
jgi:hypothetical protein